MLSAPGWEEAVPTRAADCIFCKIAAGEAPCFKLYEDDRVLSFMDINPFNDGHCLIVAKNHARTLFEAEDADLAACLIAAKRVARAVEKVVAPDGVNLLQANGPGAAQSVPHFHIHVFPRRHGDQAAMNAPQKPGDMKKIGELAERIRAQL
jgi:histidine triad (HIT) family protein